jgi:hypothetical protein
MVRWHSVRAKAPSPLRSAGAVQKRWRKIKSTAIGLIVLEGGGA